MNPDLKKEIGVYKQAIALERVFPRSLRRIIKWILYTATLTLFFVTLLYVAESSLSVGYLSFTVLTVGSGAFYFGLFLMSFSLMYFIVMLSSYYNAHFYRGIETVTHEVKDSKNGITYEVARVLLLGHKDLASSLFSSLYGHRMLERCNVSKDNIRTFIVNKKETLDSNNLLIPEKGFVTLEDIAMYVYEHDSEFQEFLLNQGVTEEVFEGAVLWTMRTHHYDKHNSRWWSRDNLGKIPVIGKEFSYGSAFMLDSYSRDIKTTAVFSVIGKDIAYAEEKINQIESALSRAKDANVILVGDEGVGKMDIVMCLNRRMVKGDSSPHIAGKHLTVFDGARFIAEHETSESLENDLVELLDQAVAAGNIVIVIDKFADFLAHAASVGVAVASIIDQYLASSELQFIVTSDPMQFHSRIENKPTLLSRFERIVIESPDFGSSIQVLEGVATALEKKHKIVFTYPAIAALAEAADRYITDGVMPDKAVGLLSEIAPSAERAKIRQVTKEYVYEFVSNKTGVPTGPVQDSERDKLLHLEDILHARVIGQDNAINAIAGVMRRARAGVGDTERPLGSFMFLGSTGIGKTETAKALAHVFFGGEEHMSRIDMSEYSSDDALGHLIGDGKDDIGTLPVLLKEKPYGVLLLDEFEKATSHVHDLFLQIVDEGYFTDTRGSKINVRNNIIIATSNAGAQMIWALAKENKNPHDSKDKIIDSIITERIYKPELINRFDGVIVFEPLKLDEQEKIAYIMLESLKDRIKKKGYDLVIDDVLVSLLVRRGYDPEFGARPMRRVLQDTVEEKIATKIIEGNLKQGDKIWFYEEDFKEAS